MLNPWVMLAIAIAWGASVAGAGWYGIGVGRDGEIAGQARINKAIEDTKEAAQQGAAAAIAANKPINTTIVQKTQREVRENTVYVDCRVPSSGVQLANEALTGKPAEPAGGGKLPPSDTPKR